MSTNLNTFFRNELLSLSNETKRKYPKIKEVKAILIIKILWHILNIINTNIY